jgi:hypothetical protein
VTRKVFVASTVTERANREFSETRSESGGGSEYDFIGGPLAAAVFAFRDFDALRVGVVSSVRSYTIVDPVFGPVVFVGVLLTDGTVEIVDFKSDPDYWASIES